MKLLSIDMDYFSSIRGGCEPTGRHWEIEFSSLKQVDSYFDAQAYDELIEYIGTASNKGIPLYIAVDHNQIVDVPIGGNPVDVYNIDHHHDIYYQDVAGKDGVTCASWGTYFIENDLSGSFYWCGRDSSDYDSMEYDVDYMTFDEMMGQTYDAIFICLSPEWFPPNLQDYFERLLEFEHTFLGPPYTPDYYDSRRTEDIVKYGCCERKENGYIMYLQDPYEYNKWVFVFDDITEITFDHIAESYKGVTNATELKIEEFVRGSRGPEVKAEPW